MLTLHRPAQDHQHSNSKQHLALLVTTTTALDLNSYTHHPSSSATEINCILHPSGATEIASQTYQFDTPIWYYHYLCIDQLLPFSKHYFSFLHNPRFQTFLHPGRPAGSKLRTRSNIESLSISRQQMPFAK